MPEALAFDMVINQNTSTPTPSLIQAYVNAI